MSQSMEQQRFKILKHLQTAPLTTLAAREALDIMHPAARIQELRAQGFTIVTHWARVNRHRVASYVLLSGGG